MSPTSLRVLTEPTYVLLGALLPDDGSGEVEVVVAPDASVRYPASARPILEYFSVPRGRSQALVDLAPFDAEPGDLDGLVTDGVLVLLPGDNEAGVRAAIEHLTVGVTASVTRSSDGRSVLLQLPGNRAAVMSPLTRAVLDSPGPRSLGDGVAAVVAGSDMSADEAWRRLLVDLTGILGTGAGHLTLTARSS